MRLDFDKRSAEKQERRDMDAIRLRDSLISPEDLQRENSFFGALDPSGFVIVAVGGRPIGKGA